MSAKPLLKIVATGQKPRRPTSADCDAALIQCCKDDPVFAKKCKEHWEKCGYDWPVDVPPSQIANASALKNAVASKACLDCLRPKWKKP